MSLISEENEQPPDHPPAVDATQLWRRYEQDCDHLSELKTRSDTNQSLEIESPFSELTDGIRQSFHADLSCQKRCGIPS
jgi:hypothetical protein